jgi:hypothetical protein
VYFLISIESEFIPCFFLPQLQRLTVIVNTPQTAVSLYNFLKFPSRLIRKMKKGTQHCTRLPCTDTMKWLICYLKRVLLPLILTMRGALHFISLYFMEERYIIHSSFPLLSARDRSIYLVFCQSDLM